MADRVAAELELHYQGSAYTHDDDLVFCHPHTGRPYDASKSRVRFKQALKRAGLRDLRFHDLRHTYGTLMAAAGTTLQGWMGHRDYKTTEIYADFAPDPSQGARWAQLAFGDRPAAGGPGCPRATTHASTEQGAGWFAGVRSPRRLAKGRSGLQAYGSSAVVGAKARYRRSRPPARS